MKSILKSFGFKSSRSSVPEPSYQAPSSSENSPQSSPERSSPARHATFSGLASRPRRKAELLATELQNSQSSSAINSSLHRYARNTLNNLASGIQPTPRDTMIDIDNLHEVVASYRYEDLNLRAFDSVGDFVDSLDAGRGLHGRQRAIVRDYPNVHHFAVDVKHHEDGASTLIVLESASAANEDALPGYTKLASMLRSKFGGSARMVVIEAEAQKSYNDCVIFALDFALAAYHKRNSVFEGWHDNLAHHGSIADQGERHKKYGPFDSGLFRNYGVFLIKGWGVLPPIFYKHCQSREVLQGVEKRQPGSLDTNVSTGANREQDESLSERMDAFMDSRGHRPRNISIEASRATKIRHALSRS
ncbi:YopJ family type III secretion system effector XopJ [Xanthomonas arboricola]